MRKCAYNVAVIVGINNVGDNNGANYNRRIKCERKNRNHTRMGVVAIGNAGWQWNTVDDFVSVVVLLAEWQQAEHWQEIVFRRHLVFRFHANVINII